MALKIPPLALVLLFAALMWALDAWFPIGTSHRLQTGFAMLLALAGLGFAVAGVMTFKRNRTTVNPLTPDKAHALVTDGVYQLSRNPMYVGFALVLAGFAVHLANPLNIALWFGFVWYLSRWQIAPEERALQALFGPAFTDYCQQVRRWL